MIDPEVLSLVTGSWEDAGDTDGLMSSLIQRMREGDESFEKSCPSGLPIALDLLVCLHSPEYSAQGRALALETLVAARLKSIEKLVALTVFDALGSSEEELQFAAVACLSDLPPEHQKSLLIVGRVFQLTEYASADVKSAAQSFFRMRLLDKVEEALSSDPALGESSLFAYRNLIRKIKNGDFSEMYP